MGLAGFGRMEWSARILLICPDCGQEHMEFADRLRGARYFACTGEDCSYRFDLTTGSGSTAFQRFFYAWHRLLVAVMPAS
jgi:hypothetical protein